MIPAMMMQLGNVPHINGQTPRSESSLTGEANFLMVLDSLTSEEGELGTWSEGTEPSIESLELFYSLLHIQEEVPNDVKEWLVELMDVLPMESVLQLESLLTEKADPVDFEDFQAMSKQEQAVFHLLAALQLTTASGNQELPTQIRGHVVQIMERAFPFVVIQGQHTLSEQFRAFIEQAKEWLTKQGETKLLTNDGTQQQTQNSLVETSRTYRPFLLANDANEGRVQGLTLQHHGQELGQALNRTQQLVIHLGEQQPKEVQQQQFLRQFQQILQRGNVVQLQNGTQMTIKLMPEHLGRLDIQLTQTNGAIVARIMTSTTMARELVESQMNQLRYAFTQQQLNVERIEVVQQPSHSLLERENQGQQSTKDEKEKEQQRQDQEHSDGETFQQFLDDVGFDEQV
ncbi:flagellar hook-length control protein FliK [Halalkalibacterium halodurans]|uniref:flagellar hook-length control protein FliK n=1 Tax=Halalkalibacterium halodurans TaxID=86665 RepID=UPI002E200CDB|nr:flagellar hook-length control protein FliK [Halalkalibacterium halodurans]